MRTRLGLVVIGVMSVGAARPARAGEWTPATGNAFDALAPPVFLVPRGMIAPAGRGPHMLHGGLFIAVAGGAAFLVGNDADGAQISGAFGARLGYDIPNGLSVFVGYDDLGVAPLVPSPDRAVQVATITERGTLQLASVGVRYTLPFFVPMLFAEATCGLAFVGDGTDFGAGAGVGVTVPFARHFSIDLAGRAFVVPLEGALRTTFTVEAGFAFSFASPGR